MNSDLHSHPLSSASGASASLGKIAWQTALYAEMPKRLDLLRLKPDWPCRSFALQVYRNEPFEYINAAMSPFLAYCDLTAVTTLSDYDDSLAFAGTQGSHPQAILIWLDYTRYSNHEQPVELASWIASRLAALRAENNVPIVLADDDTADQLNPHLHAIAEKIPGVCVFSRRAVALELGDRYWEKRGIGASRISGDGVVSLARALAFGPLVGAMLPRIKAIATDLDHTLVQGVLGEDGIMGVKLTSSFRTIQDRMAYWHKTGIFLALVSRNEPNDVSTLFSSRTDFPLRWEMFSAHAIGWEDKIHGLQRIADTLRIGLESILYVDDNPGELTQIGLTLPSISLLFAGDAAEVARALTVGPRFRSFTRDVASRAADQLRFGDLKAAAERATIAAGSATPAEYFRSLGIRLSIAWKPVTYRARLYELSRKTNQFNLAISRLEEAEVAQRLESDHHAVVSFGLSDRLSDSGVVGALFGRAEGTMLVVDELSISCRALGRQLEDVMIIAGINRALQFFPDINTVAFVYTTGQRNQPARDWLTRFSGQTLDAESGIIKMEWDALFMESRVADLPVEFFLEEEA